jgi:hypothetical protein
MMAEFVETLTPPIEETAQPIKKKLRNSYTIQLQIIALLPLIAPRHHYFMRRLCTRPDIKPP